VKITHIFWALLLVALLIFTPLLFLPSSDETRGGVTTLFSFIATWVVVSLVSPIMIAIALFRVTRPYRSFFYTLLFVLNLYFGSFTLFQLLNGGAHGSELTVTILGILNLFWSAIFIFLMTARRFRKS
jgi:hypothetical protein